jgi:hypothetical protein
MGASNRHGGQKLSRRLKVLFHTHPARREVYRHYFGVKKGLDLGAAPGAAPVAATPAAAPAEAPKS